MSETVITVTEAACNLVDCVDRVYHKNQTFVLVQNGVPFARLVPAGRPPCRGRELAEALSAAELTVAEAEAWYHDLQDARGKLEAPSDKWQ
jgi:hypothetical protein